MEKTSLNHFATDLNKRLTGCSPLEISGELLRTELTDKQDSMAALQSVYDEFESKEALEEALVKPIFFSLADLLCDDSRVKKYVDLRKTGLSPSRIINECQVFSYDGEMIQTEEAANQQRLAEHDKEQHREVTGTYEERRKKYDNPARRKSYKNDKTHDEYTGEKCKKSCGYDTDHIVPISKIEGELSRSIALQDDDIKAAINLDDNLAITSSQINRSKRDDTNEEFVNSDKPVAHKQDKKTIQTMIDKGKNARKSVENKANKRVSKNILTNKNGVTKTMATGAATAAGSQAIGTAVILVLKPLYFEISDMVKNGVAANTVHQDTLGAFKERMDRAKDYVLNNLQSDFFKELKKFISNFVNFVVNAIFQAFVGLLRSFLSIITRGIKALCDAFKTLRNPNLSEAEKADAITKIFSAVVVFVIGSYIDSAVLGAIGVPEMLRTPVKLALTSIVSGLVIYLLDKVDLFSVKDEKRLARVREVFDLRIAELKGKIDIFDHEAMAILTQHELEFRTLMAAANSKLSKGDLLESDLRSLSNFFKVNLKIRSDNEFMHLLETTNSLRI